MSCKLNKNQKLISALVGIVTGFVNGLFGGGGGMIVVPLLTQVLKRTQKKAHATAILIILPLSIVSAVLYCVFGNANFEIILPVCIGVLTGGILGAVFLKKIPQNILFYGFYVLMLVAGIKMLF